MTRRVAETTGMPIRTDVERIPMSKEEFFRLAEDFENGLIEWEEGYATRVTAAAAAHGRHGNFVSYLHVQVDSFLKQQNLGRAWPEIFIDLGKTYGADIAVLFRDHLERYVNGRIQGVPDVVVEVVSPDSESRDRVTKWDAYAQAKVAWYWIGQPAVGTLEEYRLTPEGYLRTASGSLDDPFRPRAIPGLEIDLTTLMDVV